MNIVKSAILLIGYNRPELLQKRLHELEKIDYPRLFISIDFSDDDTLIKHQRIISKWMSQQNQDKIELNYFKKNQGLTKHISNSISRVLGQFNSIIIIEDDVQMSPEAIISLDYCLSRYGNEIWFGSVSGFSALRLKFLASGLNLPRKTPYFACWGWGTTATVWNKYNVDLSNINLSDELNKSKIWHKLNSEQQSVWLGRFGKVQNNPNITWDIQFQYMSFVNNLLHVVPISSLSDNEGFNDERAVHTKGERPNWMKARNFHSISLINQRRLLNQDHLIAKFIKFYEELTLVGDRQVLIQKLRDLKRLDFKNFFSSQ
jgi:hypothetical protein